LKFLFISKNILVFFLNRETNWLVEEFMLLANISVAEKIYELFPDCACLRKHPAPPISNFDPLVKAAETKVKNLISIKAFSFFRF
jgi:exoribonuclease R